ncbi:PadR family transcriptional regulator [Peribacillus sp. B-H-3]|uniref:PadR family transcriptional regulator n=1 Tax=Peribacillus sp. B-H-3 TaxID=3400420 RepID=UPI003B01F737
MDERLKGLRKSMEETAFKDLQFTRDHAAEIREKISRGKDREEDILLAVMQLTVHEKTGFVLAKQLRSRGIKKFEDNEGSLYTVLHQLEQAGILQSAWNESAKLYQLTDKGKKVLRKAEKTAKLERFSRNWLRGEA